jgi:hypothetical protein
LTAEPAIIVQALVGMLSVSLWLPQKRVSATLWLLDGGNVDKDVDNGDGTWMNRRGQSASEDTGGGVKC